MRNPHYQRVIDRMRQGAAELAQKPGPRRRTLGSLAASAIVWLCAAWILAIILLCVGLTVWALGAVWIHAIGAWK